jgi:Flp pilus assembly protein TadG
MIRRRRDADAVEVDEATKKERQRGVVLVWMAVVLFVLIGAAAFAVDLVHAYVVEEQTQNAADAAALAGAAQMPGGCAHAKGAASNMVKTNMTKSGFATADYTQTQNCNTANEMQVDVSTHFNTWFAQAIGFPSLTVHRKGIAEYDAPVEMGSPANHLGDVPAGSCGDLDPSFAGPGTPCASDSLAGPQNLFMQINGPDTYKSNGNAYTSNWCSNNTDGCPSGGDSAGTNTDYNSSTDPQHGEYFDIDNEIGGQLTVAVYDAGFVNTGGGGGVGSWCDNTPITGTNQITGLALPARYSLASPYCVGDIVDLGRAPAPLGPYTNLPDVHYELLNPDGTSACTLPAGGGGIQGVQVPNGTDINLQPGGTAALTYFQRWVKLPCNPNFGATTPDKPYRLHVWSTTGQGTNAFSVLALQNNSPLGVSVYATEHLPLYAEKYNATTPVLFHVARIAPSNLDRTLSLSFFDLGDNPGGDTSVKLDLGTSSDVEWPGGGPVCTYTYPPGTGPTNGPQDASAPWGSGADITAAGPGCTITTQPCTGGPGSPGCWLSQWVTVTITIPKDDPTKTAPTYYHCDPSSQDNCWITMTMTPAAGTQLQDNTTWDATLNGAPVRLTG